LDKSDSHADFGAKFSKWVTLTKDQHYYVESTLKQGGGFINIDIGMEVEPDTMPAEHPNFETQV
jgi:hypothetical protein